MLRCEFVDDARLWQEQDQDHQPRALKVLEREQGGVARRLKGGRWTGRVDVGVYKVDVGEVVVVSFVVLQGDLKGSATLARTSRAQHRRRPLLSQNHLNLAKTNTMPARLLQTPYNVHSDLRSSPSPFLKPHARQPRASTT